MTQPTIRPMTMTTTEPQKMALLARTKPTAAATAPTSMISTQVQAAGLLPWPTGSAWMSAVTSSCCARLVAVLAMVNLLEYVAWLVFILPLIGPGPGHVLPWRPDPGLHRWIQPQSVGSLPRLSWSQ